MAVVDPTAGLAAALERKSPLDVFEATRAVREMIMFKGMSLEPHASRLCEKLSEVATFGSREAAVNEKWVSLTVESLNAIAALCSQIDVLSCVSADDCVRMVQHMLHVVGYFGAHVKAIPTCFNIFYHIMISQRGTSKPSAESRTESGSINRMLGGSDKVSEDDDAYELIYPPALPGHVSQSRKLCILALQQLIERCLQQLNSAVCCNLAVTDGTLPAAEGPLGGYHDHNRAVGHHAARVRDALLCGVIRLESTVPYYFPLMNECWKAGNRLLAVRVQMPTHMQTAGAQHASQHGEAWAEVMTLRVATVSEAVFQQAQFYEQHHMHDATVVTGDSGVPICLACPADAMLNSSKAVDTLSKTLRFHAQQLLKFTKADGFVATPTALKSLLVAATKLRRVIHGCPMPVGVGVSADACSLRLHEMVKQIILHIISPLEDIVGKFLLGIPTTPAHAKQVRCIVDGTEAASTGWASLLLARACSSSAALISHELRSVIMHHFATGINGMLDVLVNSSHVVASCIFRAYAQVAGAEPMSTDSIIRLFGREDAIVSVLSVVLMPHQVIWQRLVPTFAMEIQQSRQGGILALCACLRLLLARSQRGRRSTHTYLRHIGRGLLVCLMGRANESWKSSVVETLLSVAGSGDPANSRAAQDGLEDVSLYLGVDLAQKVATTLQKLGLQHRIRNGTLGGMMHVSARNASTLMHNLHDLTDGSRNDLRGCQHFVRDYAPRVALACRRSWGNPDDALLMELVVTLGCDWVEDPGQACFVGGALLATSRLLNADCTPTAIRLLDLAGAVNRSLKCMSSSSHGGQLPTSRSTAIVSLEVCAMALVASLANSKVGEVLASQTQSEQDMMLASLRDALALLTTDTPWWLFEECLHALLKLLKTAGLPAQAARSIIPAAVRDVLQGHLRRAYRLRIEEAPVRAFLDADTLETMSDVSLFRCIKSLSDAQSSNPGVRAGSADLVTKLLNYTIT